MLADRPKIEQAAQELQLHVQTAALGCPKNTPAGSGRSTMRAPPGRVPDSMWMSISCTACRCGRLRGCTRQLPDGGCRLLEGGSSLHDRRPGQRDDAFLQLVVGDKAAIGRGGYLEPASHREAGVRREADPFEHFWVRVDSGQRAGAQPDWSALDDECEEVVPAVRDRRRRSAAWRGWSTKGSHRGGRGGGFVQAWIMTARCGPLSRARGPPSRVSQA